MSTNKKKNYLMDEFSQGTYGNLLNLTGGYASPVIPTSTINSKVTSVPNNTGTQVYTGNSNAYQGGTVYLDMQNPTGSITNPMPVKHYTNESVLNSNVYGNYLKDGEPVDGSGSGGEGSGSGGEGSGSGGEPVGSGGEGSGEEKVTTAPMTFAEYSELQKGELEKQRKEAERQAEIYAQRARANAQASYAQNMSTYGINAETLAQMGLTGGGYSDYLNAQAYAQKQNAINTANANELTAKQQAQATYADNINKLEASAFEQRNTTYNSLLGMALDKTSGLTDEYIKAMADSVGLSQEEIDTIINTNNETQAKSAEEQYNALMLDLGNVNLYGNYTEDSIKAIAKSLGFEADSAETTALVDAWKATKAQAEVDLEGGKTVLYSELFDDAATGKLQQSYTRSVLEKVLKKGQADGTILGEDGTSVITDDEINEILGKLENPDYNILNGTTKTESEAIKEAKGYLTGTDDFGAPTAKYYTYNKNPISEDIIGDKVIYARKTDANGEPTTTFKDFGDYQTNDEQEDYFKAIMDAEIKGAIPEGSIIKMNYGSSGWSNENDYYMYVGEGVFVELNADDDEFNDENGKNAIWIPNGYYMTGMENIRKE